MLLAVLTTEGAPCTVLLGASVSSATVVSVSFTEAVDFLASLLEAVAVGESLDKLRAKIQAKFVVQPSHGRQTHSMVVILVDILRLPSITDFSFLFLVFLTLGGGIATGISPCFFR